MADCDMTLSELRNAVEQVFLRSFGRTPLRQRLEDVLGEAVELSRFTDMRNLKEETGDLLCSVLQLVNECNWSASELVNATLDKIDRRAQQYASLGRKTKVALLGGAFNPPHIGHVALAKFVLDSSRTFDEVWLVPANRHMNGKDMLATHHRVAMCELACAVDGRIKVFPYEIDNNLSVQVRDKST